MIDTLIRWLSKPAWTPPEGPFVQGYVSKDGGRTEILNRNGVDWFDADLPPVDHDCYVQTHGYLDWFTLVERCACGALRYGRDKYHTPSWTRVNERRSEVGAA